MPTPKIYEAADIAARVYPIRPLVGTRVSAQRYTDRVTRSDWWKNHCPGFWNFSDPAPERVWIWEDPSRLGGLMEPGTVSVLKDQEMPTIVLGHGEVYAGVEAIADRWVILHELAHVMTNQIAGEGHHGKNFCYAYIKLVHQFLGPVPGQTLAYLCRALRMRLDYRLLLS